MAVAMATLWSVTFVDGFQIKDLIGSFKIICKTTPKILKQVSKIIQNCYFLVKNDKNCQK